jgi:anti-sigma regulatory factor (Ser/Thr protein kinase)
MGRGDAEAPSVYIEVHKRSSGKTRAAAPVSATVTEKGAPPRTATAPQMPAVSRAGVPTLPPGVRNSIAPRAARESSSAASLASALSTNVEWLRAVVGRSNPSAELMTVLEDMEGCARTLLRLFSGDEFVPMTSSGFGARPLSLGKLIQRAILSVRAKRPDIEQTIDLVEGADDNVHVDPARIASLLEELLDNAQRSSQPHGRITVAYGVSGDDYVISVADDGPGPLDARPRTMPPSAIAHGVEEVAEQATFALGRSIARMHGGELSVRERPHGGALYTFRAPKHPPQA